MNKETYKKVLQKSSQNNLLDWFNLSKHGCPKCKSKHPMSENGLKWLEYAKTYPDQYTDALPVDMKR